MERERDDLQRIATSLGGGTRACKMRSRGCFAAAWQVDGFIQFVDTAEALQVWDAQIQSVCNKLNEVVDLAAGLGFKEVEAA